MNGSRPGSMRSSKEIRAPDDRKPSAKKVQILEKENTHTQQTVRDVSSQKSQKQRRIRKWKWKKSNIAIFTITCSLSIYKGWCYFRYSLRSLDCKIGIVCFSCCYGNDVCWILVRQCTYVIYIVCVTCTYTAITFKYTWNMRCFACTFLFAWYSMCVTVRFVVYVFLFGKICLEGFACQFATHTKGCNRPIV